MTSYEVPRVSVDSRSSRVSRSRRSEFDFQPHERPSAFVGVAKVAIMLVNVAFMIIAGLLIYFTAWIESIGVVAMLQTKYSWISNVTFALVLTFGAVVVLTSFVGCIGAWAKSRRMLLVYAIGQVINLSVFVLIAIGGFLALNVVESWKANPSPSEVEATIPTQFNPLYCQSQVAYYCSIGSVGESLELFLGPAIAAKAGNIFDQLYGWEQACNYSLIRVTDPALSRQVNATCELCRKYPSEKYSDFLVSIASTCPLTAGATEWCTAYFIQSPKRSEELANTPYGICRPSFLTLWRNICRGIAYCALVVIIFSIAIVVLTLKLRRLVAMVPPKPSHDYAHYQPVMTPTQV